MSTRILVVEDEEKLARFIELELVHEGGLGNDAVDAGSDDVELFFCSQHVSLFLIHI